MILRRITEHVKAQNWFAVGLDFLIVVVGVFIGLQVANWNDARKDNERAHQALEELRVDFIAINETASGLASFYEGVIGDLEILTASLRAGDVKPVDEQAIKNAIANGDIFGDPPPPSGTFQDLLSSGNLTLIEDKDLRLMLIEYDQSLDNIVESDANINNLLGHFAVAFKRHATMEANYQLPNATDLDFVDMEFPAVSSVDYEAMLADPDFRVATEQHLRLQIGRYINAGLSQSKIAQIQQLIDEKLGLPAAHADEIN